MDEAALHDLLSGRRQDVPARMLRGGLSVASGLYSLVTAARNAAYKRHWLPIHHSTVPVISVGNVTTGGTGKTPVVAWLANWFSAAGQRPGILSRGYHSLETDASGTLFSENDEKRVLDQLCPGIPHIQQRDRVRSATRATQELGCNVLVLDDGLQHRRLHRDLDLVLIDAVRPWGYGHLLPRGLLRESLHGLARADMVLLTRANQASEVERDTLGTELRRYRPADEFVEVAFTPQSLNDLSGAKQPLDSIAGKSVFAFCGIGNPTAFRQTIDALGVDCRNLQTFPDHYHYTSADLTTLGSQAESVSADVVLVTQKDLVKLSAADWNGPPLFAVEIGAEFISGGARLERELRRIIAERDGKHAQQAQHAH